MVRIFRTENVTSLNCITALADSTFVRTHLKLSHSLSFLEMLCATHKQPVNSARLSYNTTMDWVRYYVRTGFKQQLWMQRHQRALDLFFVFCDPL